MTDFRILLATPHAGYEQRVRRAFGDTLNGEVRRWDVDRGGVAADGLLTQLAAGNPDVVAIGPDVDVEVALELARRLEYDRPEISVLLVSEPTGELWQHALRAGVRDVLAPDAIDAHVRETFERTIELAARRRHNLVGDPEGAGRHGRIITVLSPKGGSGKTTVASNLAVGLARCGPEPVVVIDLDLQFGDISTALGLTPQHTLVDAARAPAAIDGMALKSFLSPHHSDLWALCGPESPADGEEVSADQARRIIETLADEFPFLVVDTGAGLDEHTLAALEVSTDLVLVCAMDVTSVRSLRKELAALEQLGMVHQHRHLVVNRADSKVGLDLKDVEASIGLPVAAAISSARVVPLSLNQGSPVIESDPRSPVAKQLGGLVQRFVGVSDHQPAAGRRRWAKR
jgi:pilus assembly protein CpaE